MEMMHTASEIVEVGEGLDVQLGSNDERCLSKQKHIYGLEDDINRLFQALDVRSSLREESLWKSRMKRPMGASTSQATAIGISEPANLKQALRGLCLLQASEMAAMKRRSLKPKNSSVNSDVRTVKRVYKAVVAEANESGLPLHEGKGNVVEISLPHKIMPTLSEELPVSAEVPWQRSFSQCKHYSTSLVVPKTRMIRAPSPDKIVPLSSEAGYELSNREFQQKGKTKVTRHTKGSPTFRKALEGNLVPSKGDGFRHSIEKEKYHEEKVKVCEDMCAKIELETHPSGSSTGNKIKRSPSNSPRLLKLSSRNKNFAKRQLKAESALASSASSPSVGNGDITVSHSRGELVCPCANRKGSKEHTPGLSVASASTEVCSDVLESGGSQITSPDVTNGVTGNFANSNGGTRSKEKGEFSQSSKSSSIGEYSSTTSNSGDSSLSGSTRSVNRPHMSNDLRWEAVQCFVVHHGSLSLRHFKLLRRLGSGDIGTVYLAQLISTNCLFALKVMDNEFLARWKKLSRAQTEREILQMLDHPFLPTLYGHFATDKLSCLVMEYCPGGDLHVLRQKQPTRNFSEQAARFYVAEVLLALEYLHMLGVVYRDLKPENVLVREDGHIMLSDFDLSLRCIVNPTVLRLASPTIDPRKKVSSTCTDSSCISPFCFQRSWEATSCFTSRLPPCSSSKTWKLRSEEVLASSLPQLIAEPTDARSNSFVGTHEYLAPEIIKGGGHGSAVDWWTLGIFLFELLYGKTPFKGLNNEETVANVISKPLRFPDSAIVSFYARDLIRGLLIKEPENRLGSVKGATEIKQHPFFEGLNWALIRCAVPPERPELGDLSIFSHKKGNGESAECESGERVAFELF